MKKTLLLVLLFLSSFRLAAESTAPASEVLSIGMGGYFQSPGKVQINESGELNSLDFHPMLSIDTNLNLFNDVIISNSIGFTLPQNGRDGTNITTWSFYTDFFYTFTPFEDWHIILGSGWIFNRISGDGGTQTLDNGISTDSFILPNGSTTSYNLTTNIGIKYFVLNDWNVNVRAFILNLFEAESRDIALSLTFQKSLSWKNLF